MCGSCQGLRCKHIGGKGYSCLHAATEAILDIHQIDSPGRYQTVEYLLKNGADVNQATESGFTPLHNAALSGFVRTADLLIKHGANVNARNGWGQTPLHLAAAKNNPAMCELLLRNGADANIRGNNDETPLSMAESIKDEEETHLWRTDTIELLKKACGEAVNVQAFADACRETRVSSQKFAFLGGRH